MPYQNYFTSIKSKLFQENLWSALQQSIELSSSSETENIQEGEVIFKKKPTVGLPEVFTIIFIIFWDFLIYQHISFSPQVKRCPIVTYKHGI